MGKIDEYASGRNDGLQLALKIVEDFRSRQNAIISAWQEDVRCYL